MHRTHQVFEQTPPPTLLLQISVQKGEGDVFSGAYGIWTLSLGELELVDTGVVSNCRCLLQTC